MKFEIKHKVTGAVIFSLETTSLKLCVEAAVKSPANLRSADLRSADLRFADLRSADLRFANLSSADLRSADLRSADLSSADLRFANLSSADLRSADLRSADLSFADLRSADLSFADLRSADLSFADLSFAKNSDRAIAYTRILPEGQIIGWKKGSKGEIIKLSIPEDSRRSHAFGRKCRCEFADVLEISSGAISAFNGTHDKKIEYRVGQRVTADSWDEDFTKECTNGIHFFITRIEAEDWSS